MPKLVAEFGADTTQFEAGLNRMDMMAERFGHKLTHHLSRAFGYGFLASQATDLIKEVFTHADEIQKTAKEIGRTTDEVQLLQQAADEAGTSLNDYLQQAKDGSINLEKTLKEIRERGGFQIIEKSDLDEIAKLKKGWGVYKKGLLDRGATVVGGYVGYYDDLLHGRFRNAGLNAARAIGAATPGIFGQAIFNYANRKLNPPHDGNEPGGGMPFFNPLFFMRLGLMNRANQLSAQEQAMRGQKTSLFQPAVTDWQSLGALTRLPTMRLHEVDENAKKMEDVRRELVEIKGVLKSIQQGNP
jgi:hypothetical protein